MPDIKIKPKSKLKYKNLDFNYIRKILYELNFDIYGKYIDKETKQWRYNSTYRKLEGYYPWQQDIQITYEHHNNIAKDNDIKKNFIKPTYLNNQLLKKHVNAHNIFRIKKENLKYDTRERLVITNQIENSIACFTRKNNRDILILDLDFHNDTNIYNQKKIIRYINQLLQNKPIYIEKSIQNRGYHIYYSLLKNKDNDVLIEKFQKILHKQNIKVDIPTHKQALRLPLAFDYVPINKINEKNECPNIIFERILDKKNNKEYEINLEKIINNFYFPNLICSNKSKKNIIKLRKHYKGDYERKYKNKKNNNINIYTDFPIYAGNRVGGSKNWLALGLYCYTNQIDLEIFIEATVKNNINSKDILKYINNNTLSKECEKIYNWCERKQLKKIKKENNDFISNLNKLKKHEIYKLKKIANNLNIKKYRYKKIELKKRKALEILLPEIWGYIRYQKESKLEIKNFKFTKEKIKLLKQQPFLPSQYLDNLITFYNLPIQSYEIIEILEKNNLIKQFKHSKRGYCFINGFNYSRQYIFKNIKLIYKEIYKKIINTIYIDNKEYNNINIYYREIIDSIYIYYMRYFFISYVYF